MPATPGEVMSQTRRKETVRALRMNPSEPSKSRCGRRKGPVRPGLTPRGERPDPLCSQRIFSQRTQVLMDDVGRGPETPSARPAPSEPICRGRGRDPDRLAYLWPGPVMFRAPGGHPDACRRFNRRLALAEIPSPPKALCPGGIRFGRLESRVRFAGRADRICRADMTGR